MFSISRNPEKLITSIYVLIFVFFLLLAAFELILPFSFRLSPYYTADIPLGLYLAYIVSYPGVCLAGLISLDTARLLYLPAVFLISLAFYWLFGIVLIRMAAYIRK